MKNLIRLKKSIFHSYVVKTFTKKTSVESGFVIRLVFELQKIIERGKVLQNQLFSSVTRATKTCNLESSFFMNLISPYLHCLALLHIFHVEVEYIRKINVSINHSSFYHHEKNYGKPQKTNGNVISVTTYMILNQFAVEKLV